MTEQKLIDGVETIPLVHAYWHDVYRITPIVAMGTCSNCRTKSYVSPRYPFAKYCPACAAQMDGEEECKDVQES